MNIGDVMKNGATVVDVDTSTGGTDRGIVLATWQRNAQPEFITWWVDKDGDAYWGHYFNSQLEAREDFDTRRRG